MANKTKTAAPELQRRAPFVIPTKLRPPHVRDGLLERPALVEKLRSGREQTLTLVCAPAGYGKTTLLAQWALTDAGRTPFAWVSLDAMDADPARLWSHMLTALQEVHHAVGKRSFAAFGAGPRAIAETALPLLIEELTDSPPIVLVLEDWHIAANLACDATVGAFVEHAPSTVQVVISSRQDPGLPIARLRAHDDLLELRARDLSISSDEADALFRDAGIRLTSRDVRRLTERTEGWLAGLRLTAVVLRDQADPEGFIDQFSDGTRDIFDYLARDVLATVDPAIRDFMARSSVLDTFSAPLCDAVLERTDSAAMLTELERSNLFVIPLDATGSEYRYHHLFAAFLTRQLNAADPGAVSGLHARASRWFEDHGDVERAIDHAIAAGDAGRASTLVVRIAVPMISSGRLTTLNRWFDALSWPEAQRDRELAAVRALAARLSGQGRDEVERWLRVAEDGPDHGPLTIGISSFRAMVAMVSSTYLSRGIADAERSAKFVLESEPAESPWRYAGLVPLGQALFLAGRGGEARAPLEEARTLPNWRQHATSALALAYLALIELADGDVERSELLARDSVALAEEIGHAATPTAANPHLALGCVLMRGADLHAAIEHLERAVELAGSDESSYWHAHANIHLAAARHRLGDADGSRAALADARAALDELPDVGMLGDLYWETHDALNRRVRHEGFLGDDLSAAERRALGLLVQGLSVSEVARELWLSPNTVKTHRRSIYRKLGATTREQMIERAAEARTVSSDTSDIHPDE